MGKRKVGLVTDTPQIKRFSAQSDTQGPTSPVDLTNDQIDARVAEYEEYKRPAIRQAYDNYKTSIGKQVHQQVKAELKQLLNEAWLQCISNQAFDGFLAKMNAVVSHVGTEFNLTQFQNQWYMAADEAWKHGNTMVLLDHESHSQFRLRVTAALRAESAQLRAELAQQHEQTSLPSPTSVALSKWHQSPTGVVRPRRSPRLRAKRPPLQDTSNKQLDSTGAEANKPAAQ